MRRLKLIKIILPVQNINYFFWKLDIKHHQIGKIKISPKEQQRIRLIKVDGITIEDVNEFCCWLSLRDLTNQLDEQRTFWYRLPTTKERDKYGIGETYFDKKNGIISFNFDRKTGISLVRCTLPLKYKQLAEYLMRGEWKKADEETLRVMLRVANRENHPYLDEKAIDNFPCEDLGIIDGLWVCASNGKFGFSVQKDIYQSLGGKKVYDEKVWINFCERIGWRAESKWLLGYKVTYNLDAPLGHMPTFVSGGMESSSSGGFRANNAQINTVVDFWDWIGDHVDQIVDSRARRPWVDKEIVPRDLVFSSLAHRIVKCNI